MIERSNSNPEILGLNLSRSSAKDNSKSTHNLSFNLGLVCGSVAEEPQPSTKFMHNILILSYQLKSQQSSLFKKLVEITLKNWLTIY